MEENEDRARPAPAAGTIEVDETDRFLLLDMLDEAQLAQEMAGEVVTTYVYKVEQWDQETRQKKIVHQLSKSGVDAVCRELATKHEYIREGEMDWRIDRQAAEAFFRVRVERYRRTEKGEEILMDVVHGVKRQPFNYRTRDGREFPNPHWFEHGAMKACRNGRRRMIPEKFAVELIAAWAKEKGRVQSIDMTTRSKRQEAVPKVAAPAPAATTREREPGEETDVTAETREQVLAKITRELDQEFGEGEPARVPGKDAVLRRIFKTSHWPSLKQMPEARFLQMWNYANFRDAIVLVREEGA